MKTLLAPFPRRLAHSPTRRLALCLIELLLIIAAVGAVVSGTIWVVHKARVKAQEIADRRAAAMSNALAGVESQWYGPPLNWTNLSSATSGDLAAEGAPVCDDLDLGTDTTTTYMVPNTGQTRYNWTIETGVDLVQWAPVLTLTNSTEAEAGLVTGVVRDWMYCACEPQRFFRSRR